MSTSFVTITTVYDLAQAEMICGTLRAEDIEAHVPEQMASGTLGGMTLGGVRVQVRDQDAERARAVLKSAGFLDEPSA